MELSGPEYENMDYELVLAEILHTQEHLFGNSLIDGVPMHSETLELDHGGDNSFYDDHGNEMIPICDVLKQGAGDSKEPKLEEQQ